MESISLKIPGLVQKSPCLRQDCQGLKQYLKKSLAPSFVNGVCALAHTLRF